MRRTIHLIAAIVATLTIAVFFASTVYVELFGSYAAVAQVKRSIVTPGLWVLVPAIAVTGATGFLLARGRGGRLVDLKKRRMPFIAANGIVVLLPSAIYLDALASRGAFDATFYIVQVIELIAGAVNLGLMALNARDGLRLSGHLPVPGLVSARR